MTTSNINLELIDGHDLIDHSLFNTNFNLIDTAIGALETETDKIPTMQSAIADNNDDISDLQTTTANMSNTIGTNTQDIADIKTVNTNQNNRIAALENEKPVVIMNDSPLTIEKEATVIVDNLSPTSHPSGGVRVSVQIPISELPIAENYLVTTAIVYNNGIASPGGVAGYNLISATVYNNKLQLTFNNISGDVASENLTMVAKVICY